jgi:hypothetical protein
VAGGLDLPSGSETLPFDAGSTLLASGGAATGSLGLFKWGLGGILAGSVYVTGVRLAEHVMAPTPNAAPPVPAATVVPPRLLSPAPAAEPPAIAPPTPPVPNAAASAATRLAPEPAGPDQRLAEELALLDRVRASIDARRPAVASSLLAEHEHRFGRAAPLSPEARYLALEAFLAAGRKEEARAAAREILQRDSGGPHASRARAVLEEGDPGGAKRR